MNLEAESTPGGAVNAKVDIKELPGGQIENLYVAGVVYGGMGNKIRNETQCTELENILEFTDKMMNSIDMKQFVSTHAERAAFSSVMSSGCVMITGKSGSGKTTIGLKLLTLINEKTSRIPVILTSPQQLDKLSVAGTEFVVMIDNIFGSTNLVDSHLHDWERTFEIMWPQLESGQLLLILTSRPKAYGQCKRRLSKYKVFQNADVIALDDDKYALTPGEIKRLLKRYCWGNFTPSELTEISNSDINYAIGFPLCCSFFAENDAVKNKGVSFFLNPKEGIVSEIGRLKECDQLGFYILLLVLFKDSFLSSKVLTLPISEESKSFLEEVRQFCNLDSVPTVSLLREKAKQLCGIYLFQSNLGFHFQHQSVFDAVVLSISEDYLQHFIDICPSGVLHEYVRVHSSEFETNEKVVIVPCELYPNLADKLTEILMNQRTSDILQHQSLSDHSFAQVLVKRWFTKGITEILSLHLEPKSVFVDAFDITHAEEYSPYSNLNHMFRIMHLFKYSCLISHLIMTQSPLLGELVSYLKKENVTLPSSIGKEALLSAFYTGTYDLTFVFHEEEGASCMTTLRVLIMSPKANNDLILKALDDIKALSHKEHRELLSLSVQSGNEEAVKRLVEMLKRFQNSPDTISKCLIQLLLQSSEEIKNKPQFIPSSSRNITTIMEIFFNTSCRYQAGTLISLASAHDDPSALKYLLKRIQTFDLSDHKSLHFQLACEFGSAKCVKELVQKGTDLRIVGVLNTSFRANQAVKAASATNTDRHSERNNCQIRSVPQRCEYQMKEICHTRKYNIERDSNNDNIENLHGGSLIMLEEDDYIEPLRSYKNHIPRQSDNSNRVEYARQETSFIYLHVAASSQRDSFEKVKIILFALSKKALRLSASRKWESGLKICMPTNIFDECLIHKEDFKDVECINSQNQDGSTPLHVAAARGNPQTIDVLLQAGADANCMDGWGLTPLKCALLGQNPECVRLLMRPPYKLDALQEILTCIHEELVESEGNSWCLSGLKKYGIRGSKIQPGKLCQILDIFLELTHDVDFIDLEGKSSLLTSVESGNMEVAKFLLSKGANINKRFWGGKTVLHVAAREQYFFLLKLLCENGADVNIADEVGSTIIHEAARSKYEALEKVEYLLKVKKASPAADNDGRTALFGAVEEADMELVEYLSQNGFSVHHLDSELVSLLHVACTVTDEEKIDVLKALFEMDIDQFRKDEHGQNPLHVACRNGSLKWVCHLLSRGFTLLTKDKQGRSMLHLAAESGNAELVKMLLDKEQKYPMMDKAGKTPLHVAVEYNQDAVVHFLISKHIAVNHKDLNGRTALLYSIQRSNVDTACAFIERNLETSHQDNDGTSPLHAAVEIASLVIVMKLLQSNVDLTVQNKKGQTAFHIAVKMGLDNILHALLKSDASAINKQDDDGKTALHYSCIHPRIEIIQMLLDHGADIQIRDCNRRTILHVAAMNDNYDAVSILLELGINVSEADDDGNTALHLAAEVGSLDTLELLLKRKCDIRIQNNQGRSPLHLAAKGQHVGCIDILIENGSELSLSDEMGMTPLQLGEAVIPHNHRMSNKNDSVADLDPSLTDTITQEHDDDNFDTPTLDRSLDTDESDVDDFGETSLHKAVMSGTYSSIQRLLVSGADPSTQDSQGRTSLHLAVVRGDKRIVELLLKHQVNIRVSDKSGKTAIHIASEEGRKDIDKMLLEFLCLEDLQEEGAVDTNKERRKADGVPLATLPPSRSFEKSLFQVVQNGNSDEVRKVLSQGDSSSVVDRKERTVLHYAAMRGDSDILQIFLLKHNMNNSTRERKGLTPLHFAAKLGRYINVKLLIDSGAVLDLQDSKGFTPLHYAANIGDFDTVKLLTMHKCNADIKNKQGQTALHLAAMKGSRRCVMCLLEVMKDVSAADRDGKTAYRLSKINNHTQCAKLIQESSLNTLKP